MDETFKEIKGLKVRKRIQRKKFQKGIILRNQKFGLFY